MAKTTVLTEDLVPDLANDFLMSVDTSDTTMAPTGTNKKVKPETVLAPFAKLDGSTVFTGEITIPAAINPAEAVNLDQMDTAILAGLATIPVTLGALVEPFDPAASASIGVANRYAREDHVHQQQDLTPFVRADGTVPFTDEVTVPTATTGAKAVNKGQMDAAIAAALDAAGISTGVDVIVAQIETVAVKAYILDLKAVTAYSVTSFTRDVLGTGSCTASMRIDGVDITGLAGLACNQTETETNATGLNNVAVGQTLALVVTANSAALDLVVSVKTLAGSITPPGSQAGELTFNDAVQSGLIVFLG